MAKLYYQGHGSFRLTTAAGTVIYVDPFAGAGYDLPADFILVSHEHYDHNAIELVRQKADCKIYRSADLLVDGVYKTVSLGEVTVQAVPAYNKNHDRASCVGFLLEIDGVKLYAAGDTSKTDYMEENLSKMALDYALLPMDGIYNMPPKEAEVCAGIIGAKHTIPIHMKPGALFDRAMADAFQCAGKLVLEPGEEIDL